jgi:hypothetical protein
LREALWSILPAGRTLAGHWLRAGLGLAAIIAGATAAQGAEPASPLEVRARGSFPLQYIESISQKSRQDSFSYAPYLDLKATAQLPRDIETSVFANGGHNELGSFRDGDNTFLSFGTTTEKKLGKGFSAGVSAEHTHYYTGTFGQTSNIANDLTVFANYSVKLNSTLTMTTGLRAETRFGDDLALQRHTYSFRVNIQQQLADNWWFVATSRIRYADYVGIEAGRRDISLGLSAGLKYRICDSVGFTVLAAVEDRQSNIASKLQDKFAAGASIDFDIDFVRPRWPGGR